MRYYLAYGSNLNKEQMARRCPGAEPIGAALIHDYELVFRRGFLTIEPSKGQKVPVGIWTISEADLKRLDRYEGWPHFYRREYFRVPDAEGHEMEALVYIMNNGFPVQMPSDAYFYTVYNGYNDFGIADKGPLVKAYEAAKWGDEE